MKQFESHRKQLNLCSGRWTLKRISALAAFTHRNRTCDGRTKKEKIIKLMGKKRRKHVSFIESD